MSSTSKICYVEVWETVQADRKCKHTENVLAARLLLQRPVQWRLARGWVQLRRNDYGNLYNSTCREATKTLQLFLCKLHVIQKLLLPDCEKLHFCEWLFAKVEDDPRMLDEAWFHLIGYVTSQNTRSWSAGNRHAAHGTSLQRVKFRVWCAVSYRSIVGPIFF
jgi:hypothetical protein